MCLRAEAAPEQRPADLGQLLVCEGSHPNACKLLARAMARARRSARLPALLLALLLAAAEPRRTAAAVQLGGNTPDGASPASRGAAAAAAAAVPAAPATVAGRFGDYPTLWQYYEALFASSQMVPTIRQMREHEVLWQVRRPQAPGRCCCRCGRSRRCRRRRCCCCCVLCSRPTEGCTRFWHRTSPLAMTTRFPLPPPTPCWQVPPSPRGTLFVAHGCTHAAHDWWPPSPACPHCLGLPEEVAQTQQALARGYAGGWGLGMAAGARRLAGGCGRRLGGGQPTPAACSSLLAVDLQQRAACRGACLAHRAPISLRAC